ncbi:RNA pseudouridine synthase 1 [Cardamine amara subsp. amara]|uniref:RNA pseudouridine synthase 1 n=1 Tax=Cardamine amara subsp. amara TaxID=228776 RepID=A0ABD0ZNI2_CARAN
MIVVVEGEHELSYDGDDDDVVVVVRAFPRSGMAHQIRLHCQFLFQEHLKGMSLLGHPTDEPIVVIRASLLSWAAGDENARVNGLL